jgi:hypothetical protein
MGLISNFIAYKVGKRVGEGRSPEYAHDPECIHYYDCVAERGCASRACEFQEMFEE